MILSNIPVYMDMLFNVEIFRFLKKVHAAYKADDNYSLLKLVRAGINMARGEKIVKYEDKYVLTSFLPPLLSKAYYSCMNAVKKKDNKFTQLMNAQVSAPISFYLSVTDKCMYNCFHCSAKHRKKGKELTTGGWIKVLSEIQDMGSAIIGFTGGEPLLRNDIEELIGAVDKRSITYLFTTGKQLTYEKALGLKKKGLFGIGISLDSHIPEKHDQKRRSKNSFKSAVRAIQNSVEAGLYTMVQTVILRKELSKENLFELLKLCRKLGVHEVRILEPIRSGNLSKKDIDDVFYTDEDRQRLIRIQSAANRRIGFPKVTTFAKTESEEHYGCGAGIQHSYINSSGELLPCDFVPISFGNVLKTNIKKLWENMNKLMKGPKCGCFAMKNYDTIHNNGKNDYPLPIKDSIRICKAVKTNGTPKYYRILQGKK